MLLTLITLLAIGSMDAPIETNPESIVFDNVLLVDGTGAAPYLASVGTLQGKIAWVKPYRRYSYSYIQGAETKRIDGRGLVLAPGFIDSHSHADGGIAKDPSAESQIRQGVTTAVVGQDGIWNEPFVDAMTRISNCKPAINFAAFSGHGGIRGKVMGDDWQRWSSPTEREQMKSLVDADMKAGALGLSSGLEYNPAFFGNTEEVIDLAKVASKYHGIYISHVRNEDTNALQSFQELIRISKEANLPAQISHIKLALPSVWGQSKKALNMFDAARKDGLDITADIYPYTYWQSGITVLTPSRDWDQIGVWRKGIEDLGGADKIRLSECTYKPEWAGLTIQEIAEKTNQEPEDIVQEIVLNSYGPGKTGRASVIVTAMCEPDIVRFMKWPNTSFCSDGSIGGSHPRGAGTFPRVLGYYVREAKVMSLETAIYKMTGLPAKRFGFKDRGLIKEGMKADMVLFDPKTIKDIATPNDPTAFSKGVKYVVVNGKIVLDEERMTKARPGSIITRTGKPFKPAAGLVEVTALSRGYSDYCGG